MQQGLQPATITADPESMGSAGCLTSTAAPPSDAPRPADASNIRRNFCWMLIGNVIYAACQWGILVALAKLGSPEMVGVFGLALAITAPIVMFFNLELRSVLLTDAKREYSLADYVTLCLITSAMALAVIAVTAVICCKSESARMVVITMGVAKAIESVSAVLYGFFQNRERMGLVAVSMVIKGFLGLAALSMAVYLTRDCFWAVFALAVAWTIILFGYDVRRTWRLRREEAQRDRSIGLRPRVNPRALWRLARLSLPLGCSMMLVSLNVNIPRYFLEGYFGARQLGLFIAVAYIMVAVSTVVSALGQAAGPQLAVYYTNRKPKAFYMLLGRLVALIAGLSGAAILLAVIAGEKILTILYRREYASGADVFVWLMVAAGIGGVGVILRYANIAARRLAMQFPLWIIIVASNALACILLIPRYGVTGAGMAMTVAAVMQVVGNLLVLLCGSAAKEAIAAR